MRRARLGAAAALITALLAGCVQPAEPTPSASPSPTFMCTPEAGGAEAPCSEVDYQKMKEKDALYAEAERVYRKYQAEVWKSAKSGGTEVLPKSLKSLIASEKVRAAVLAQLANVKARELIFKGEEILRTAARLPDRTSSGSEVAMDFCTDSRKVKIIRMGKLVSNGRLGYETAYFAAVDGSLKIVDMSAREVSECSDG